MFIQFIYQQILFKIRFKPKKMLLRRRRFDKATPPATVTSPKANITKAHSEIERLERENE